MFICSRGHGSNESTAVCRGYQGWSPWLPDHQPQRNMLTCWTTVYIDALACMFSKGCFMTCFPASEKSSWNSRSQDRWQLEACFTHFACGSATYWHQPTQNSIQYVCVSVCVGDSPRAGALRSNAWHIFRISVFFFFWWMCVGQEHKPDVAEVSWQYVTMSAMGNC